MATLWKKHIAGKTYEVRSAGASIRLYTDGVFHSQFNERRPLSGSIWDLLVLPALFDPKKIQRVLILGLGGGAVVRSLKILLPKIHITALEIDPTHIFIAKKYFGIKKDKSTHIIKADAIEWLKTYRGKKFDFILDDLFLEKDGFPDKAASGLSWNQLLINQLSSKGVLAINFDSNQALRQSLSTAKKEFTQFCSRYALAVPKYDNRIAALFRTPVSKDAWKSMLQKKEVELNISLERHLILRMRKI